MHINAALWEAVTMVYNITDPKELARFSSHSIHAGACVALHATGVSKMYIKFAWDGSRIRFIHISVISKPSWLNKLNTAQQSYLICYSSVAPPQTWYNNFWLHSTHDFLFKKFKVLNLNACSNCFLTTFILIFVSN
jgi:hypothetical protein